MNKRKQEESKWFELYTGCCNQIKQAWPNSVVNERNRWPRIELVDGEVTYAGSKRKMMLFADPSGRTGKWAFVLWTECDKPVLRAALQDYFAKQCHGLDPRISLEWQRGMDVNSDLGYVMKFRTKIRSWEKDGAWKMPHIVTNCEISGLQAVCENVVAELKNAGFGI